MKVTPSQPSKPLYPHLAVTLGDPAGIGPEVVLKALADPKVRENCHITLIGTLSVIERAYQQLQTHNLPNPETLSILDIPLDKTTLSQIMPGMGNAASGEASFIYLREALTRTLAGEFQGIVTAPIAKSCWKLAGYNYPGQTEVLATAAGVQKFGMLFVARSPHTGWILRTLLATTHIPLNQVSESINPSLMSLKLDLLIECLKTDFGISTPEIAIAGLNPHSGEQGQLGTEEKDWLNAWLEEQRHKYPQVRLVGLIPPDTMWVKPAQAWYGGCDQGVAADGYLALYHDQGLIPVKLMAFDQAINTTIGLPFIRTSPDHGTAFDIAGKGLAKASSMKEALNLAAQLTRQRMI